MNIQDYIKVGEITKTIGLKGAVQLKLNSDFRRLYNKIETLFIEVGGQQVPFFVTKITLKSGDLVVMELEDVDTDGEAQPLINSSVYVTDDILPKVTGNEFFHHEIIGYKVIDEVHGELGLIEDIMDLPMQTIINVNCKGKEVLIPLAGDILKKIGREEKTIYVNCPEGLVELYTGSGLTDIPDDGQDEPEE